MAEVREIEVAWLCEPCGEYHEGKPETVRAWMIRSDDAIEADDPEEGQIYVTVDEPKELEAVKCPNDYVIPDAESIEVATAFECQGCGLVHGTRKAAEACCP